MIGNNIQWQQVGCCDNTTNHNLIFYSYKDKKFYFENFISSAEFDQSIQFCPWCGQSLKVDLLLRIY